MLNLKNKLTYLLDERVIKQAWILTKSIVTRRTRYFNRSINTIMTEKQRMTNPLALPCLYTTSTAN